MNRRLLFLSVGVAALGFATALGCTVTETPATVPEDAGTPDSKPRTPAPPPDEEEEEDAGACPLPNAPTPTSTWTPQKPHADACSSDELVKINALLKSYGSSVTFGTFQTDVANDATISDTCGACIFTDREESTWGPIPLTASATGSINYEGCYAQFAGNEDCGKNYLVYDDCLRGVCDDCAAAGAARSQCYGTAYNGVCKPSRTAWETACGVAPAFLDKACGTIGKVIETMCGATGDGGAPDGG